MPAPRLENPAARKAPIGEGVIAGLIGAAVVALFYLGVDIMRGHPLLTPSVLGEVFVLRQQEAVTTSVDLTAAAIYTVVHILTFVVFGLILAVLARKAERSGLARYGAIQLMVIFTVAFLGLLMVASESTRGLFPVAGVLIANILAALAMGWYLWHRNPGIKEALDRVPLGAVNK